MKNHVIPAKAGIQMIKNTPRNWDNIAVLSASQRFLLLDTGLRRYDGLMNYLGLTKLTTKTERK